MTTARDMIAKAMYERQRLRHPMWPTWDDLPFDSPNSAHHLWLDIAEAAETALISAAKEDSKP